MPGFAITGVLLLIEGDGVEILLVGIKKVIK